MKIKKILVLAVSALSLAASLTAQVIDQNINPLNVAHALALKTPVHYKWQLGAELLVSNNWKQVQMEFEMEKDFSITSLKVGGKAIPLPKPILSIPIGDGGLMRNVYAYVQGFTKDGRHAGSGNFNKYIVSKEDSIRAIFNPAEVEIQLPLPTGLSQSDIILQIEGFPYSYGYGFSDGKFTVSLPPIGGSYNYTIKTSDGRVVSQGKLEPFKAAEIANNGYVGLTYRGNVEAISFEDGDVEEWESRRVQFDCNIPISNAIVVPGKVFFADVGHGGLEVIAYANCIVRVQSAQTDGIMPFLPLENLSVIDGNSTQIRYVTQRSIGKVVITVIPNEKGGLDGTWVNFHRFYGPLANPSGGNGGGNDTGKGSIEK